MLEVLRPPVVRRASRRRVDRNLAKYAEEITALSRASRRRVDRNPLLGQKAGITRPSRLTQARGSKLETKSKCQVQGTVAPHAGAWIETGKRFSVKPSDGVAPHAGAWIETNIAGITKIINPVAPHAGAWIETAQPVRVKPSLFRSRLTQARGSKQKLFL